VEPNARLVNRDVFLSQIDGMLYGDDPKQGVVDGQSFRHPDLRLAFRVPDKFTIVNGKAQVTAIGPDQKAQITFDGASVPAGRPMTTYLQDDWTGNMVLGDLESLTINGMEAATGSVRVKGQSGPLDVRGVAIRFGGTQVYRFRFLTDPSVSAAYSEGLRETTYSFKKLSAKQAAAIRPHKLLVVPTHPNDSVASLSRSMPHGRYNAAMFKVLNDLRGNDGLEPGRMIKTVIR
jgi:predicted Zn-dependent protease